MGAEILGNGALAQFDVLIIGSGMSGGVAAGMLCQLGLKVLILEAGPNHFDGLDDPDPSKPVSRFSNDELKHEVRSFVAPDPLVEPRTFRNSAADGDRLLAGDVNGLPKTVGGGAVHADLKMPRFAPQDFQLGTLLGQVPGASFADWPVQYDALEPFYGYLEAALGVQGLDGADPHSGPRGNKYPMPPGTPMYAGLLVQAGAQQLGYSVFPYPAAVNSRPYGGRPACGDCGFCSGYGCPTNAKGSPAVTLLRQALLSGNCQLWPETRAVKLLSSGSQITGVSALGFDGQPRVFWADRYLLAASPIEDARLLLLSGNLGNSSGQVGRNLMFHLQTGVAGVFEQRLHMHRGRAVSHGSTDFRGVPGDPDRPLGGMLEIGQPPLPIAEVTSIYLGALGATGARLKALIRQSPFRDRTIGFTMQGEDAPQPTNLVDLDPAVRDLDGLPVARVTYQNHPFELYAREFYGPKLVALMGAAGAKYGYLEPPTQVPASRHIMGTLRFGTDPATSVCGPDGRFHDLGNLYCADGALFPTSSGYNPSLTIGALACRIAAGMVYADAPERALSPAA